MFGKKLLLASSNSNHLYFSCVCVCSERAGAGERQVGNRLGLACSALISETLGLVKPPTIC